MMVHTTEQIMTTVEDARNIADMKYSMFPVVRHGSEIHEQTRLHSKLINLLEVEQIYSCANKMDCDTAGSKKSATRISFEKTPQSVETLERTRPYQLE